MFRVILDIELNYIKSGSAQLCEAELCSLSSVFEHGLLLRLTAAVLYVHVYVSTMHISGGVFI